LSEVIDPYDASKESMNAQTTLTFWDESYTNAIKFFLESNIHSTTNWKSYVDVRVTNQDASYPIITLLEDTSTWKVGKYRITSLIRVSSK
jgi:hypothetical protein